MLFRLLWPRNVEDDEETEVKRLLWITDILFYQQTEGTNEMYYSEWLSLILDNKVKMRRQSGSNQ